MGKEIEREYHFQSEQLIHNNMRGVTDDRFGTEKMCLKNGRRKTRSTWTRSSHSVSQ